MAPGTMGKDRLFGEEGEVVTKLAIKRTREDNFALGPTMGSQTRALHALTLTLH